MLVQGCQTCGPGAVTDLPVGPNQLYLFISGVTYQFQHFYVGVNISGTFHIFIHLEKLFLKTKKHICFSQHLSCIYRVTIKMIIILSFLSLFGIYGFTDWLL